MSELTGKQAAFKDEYARNGQNQTQAAKTAKYQGNDNTLAQIGHKLVKNGKVKVEIDKEIAKVKAESIANREERQQFWTETMNNAPQMADRLRASELLGKSEADFTDNIKQTGDGLTINVSSESKSKPEPDLKLVKGA